MKQLDIGAKGPFTHLRLLTTMCFKTSCNEITLAQSSG